MGYDFVDIDHVDERARAASEDLLREIFRLRDLGDPYTFERDRGFLESDRNPPRETSFFFDKAKDFLLKNTTHAMDDRTLSLSHAVFLLTSATVLREMIKTFPVWKNDFETQKNTITRRMRQNVEDEKRRAKRLDYSRAPNETCQ